MNQLYGGQEKYALVEVELLAGKAGEARDVASVQLAYENPVTRERLTAGARGQVRFSADTAEVAKSVNAPVQRAVVLNVSAEANDRAIAQADQGKLKEASTELKKAAAELKAAATALNDKELEEKAVKQEAQADEMEKQGKMSSKGRKSLRTDSYQERNQQFAH